MEGLVLNSPLRQKEVMILDGGLSSQLSAYVDGIDDDPLWTARSVVKNPEAVTKAHMDFINAGARVVLTDSYQISCEGFQKYLEMDRKGTLDAVKSSVRLARSAVRQTGLLPAEVLVGGSVGPYGACQHDGSEYTGVYLETMSREELVTWHTPRIQALVEAGVDFIAAETLPSWREAVAVLDCLAATAAFLPVWVSFTLSNADELPTRESLRDAIRHVRNHELFAKGRVFGLGVNCCHPDLVGAALDNIRAVVKTTPLVVYPNSGEIWNGTSRDWEGQPVEWDTYVKSWLSRGVAVVGGCCRTRAHAISKLRLSVAKALLDT